VNAAAESASAVSRGHRNATLAPKDVCACACGSTSDVRSHTSLRKPGSPAKWYARWRAHGETGLLDHSSRPATSPTRTPEDVADLVAALRRQTKHGPARLAADLQRLHGVTPAPAPYRVGRT